MKTVLFAGLLALSAPAFAQEAATADTLGPYLGLGATHSDHEWMSGKSTNVKLFGGYDLNARWGVEMGTSKLGRYHSHLNDPFNNFTQSTNFKGRTSYLAAKFTAPMTDSLSVQTKLGLSHNRGRLHFLTSGVPGPLDIKESTEGVYAGLGVKYRLSPKASLLLEVERQGKQLPGGPKNEAVSLNASYSF